MVVKDVLFHFTFSRHWDLKVYTMHEVMHTVTLPCAETTPNWLTLSASGLVAQGKTLSQRGLAKIDTYYP